MLLYAATVLVSSFLLFLVQPIIAKQILPWFGGTAAVWTTCLVFFQVALLSGYTYSDLSSRLSAKRQSLLHIVLLALSLGSLPIVAQSSWKPVGNEDPLWRILGLLSATIGLPYFMLSTTGPLVQSWFAREQVDPRTAQRVYRFFALSNLGSLLGLLSYPFAIETWISTRTQALGWSIAYVLYALLAIGSALRALRTATRAAVTTSSTVDSPPDAAKADAEAAAHASTPPHASDYALWFVLAALASVLLLSVSNHITQNVASIPFLWVLPLTLYLLTFVLVFEGRGGRGFYARSIWLLPTLIFLAAMAGGLARNNGLLRFQLAVPLYCIGLFLGCMFCHGELAAAKPPSRYLTRFYLMMSAGGAAGGLLVGLLAPRVFTAYMELPLGLLSCALVALWLTRPRRKTSSDETKARPATAWQAVWIWLAPISALFCSGLCAYYVYAYRDVVRYRTIQASRNFYGVLRVTQNAPDTDPEARRRLIHGVIIHGEEDLAPDRRNKVKSYFGSTSGLGLALTALQRPNRRVGVLGLGIGTSAAYGRPGDTFRLYEINPQVLDAASRYFNFLSSSAATIETVLGDARLVLEREAPQQFDFLAVDAFSGDSIPIHLVTREALQIYRRHMKPNGVIAFNVTNRYLNVAPVLKQLADDAGYQAILIRDDAEQDDDLWHSDWVLLTNSPAVLGAASIQSRTSPILPIPGLRLWTDDFNNLFQILK